MWLCLIPIIFPTLRTFETLGILSIFTGAAHTSSSLNDGENASIAVGTIAFFATVFSIAFCFYCTARYVATDRPGPWLWPAYSANPVDNSHEFSKHWCSFPTCRMHADSVRLEQLPTSNEPASPISGTSRNQPNAFSAQREIIGQISTCFRRKRKVNFSEQCTATKVLKRGTKKERCFRFSNWVGEPSSFMARVGREGREV